MTLWLTRTGSRGEHAARFFADARIYLTWSGFSDDLSAFDSQSALRERLAAVYPGSTRAKLLNWRSQIWAFSHEMEKGDWVVVPLKGQPYVAVAEILGDYEHDAKAEDPYYHSRRLKWIAKEVPRTAFYSDLLMSMGAFMTV